MRRRQGLSFKDSEGPPTRAVRLLQALELASAVRMSFGLMLLQAQRLQGGCGLDKGRLVCETSGL